MPYALEQSLKRQYSDRDPEERDRITYATMNKMGMMHGSKITAKGRAYDKKHQNSVQTEALNR